MAKVLEQIIAIKISKIVKDSTDEVSPLHSDVCATLINSIPDLAESIINDPTIVVEVIELE